MWILNGMEAILFYLWDVWVLIKRFSMTAYNEAAGLTKKAIWNHHSTAVNVIS